MQPLGGAQVFGLNSSGSGPACQEESAVEASTEHCNFDPSESHLEGFTLEDPPGLLQTLLLVHGCPTSKFCHLSNFYDM